MEDNIEGEDEHDEMRKNVVRALPFFKLLSYADFVDWILMGLGTLGSIVHGMALPVGYLLLGKALNAFGNNIHDTNAMVHALKKVPIALNNTTNTYSPSLIILLIHTRMSLYISKKIG